MIYAVWGQNSFEELNENRLNVVGVSVNVTPMILDGGN